ncbi:TetR/AcrR family transcriptional regulator [Allopusillimonas ginsengisoli]|uniref:TetR/AcrR family transcriptional regulator n=1 Tax=Allopusillimonas ginsengisoli TaxID=453575 RepID=UPI001021BA2A|nr:helix-turn-helix domain-containing protein [Allopusillimonas ginsengisoli]TEA71932.1 TetR/AcrR family transcriptional regulator [Allopusillimonas ginsengisoli]
MASNSKLSDMEAALLDSTEQLIYANGIHATGMDAIVKHSGVARKIIYTRYSTKQKLVAATLRRRHVRWMEWFVAATSVAAHPYERILSMFPALESWFGTPDFHGCAFLNAAGEIGDPDDEIRQVARMHKERLLTYLQDLTRAGGYRDPDSLARQLLMLINGAIADAMIFSGVQAAQAAHSAACQLMQTSLRESGHSPLTTKE